MLKCLLAFALTLGICQAKEKDAATWITELTENYRKLDGYLATYEASNDEKSLKFTIGSTELTSRFVVHCLAVKDGKQMEMKFWIDDEDIIYTEADGQRFKFIGFRDGVSFITSFQEIQTDLTESPSGPIVFMPYFLLTKDAIEGGTAVYNRRKPYWAKIAEVTEVGKVTDKEVTFLTKEHGSLTIDRATGIMNSQLVSDGEKAQPELKLAKLVINPEAKAITSLSQSWSTLGAEPASLRGIFGEFTVKSFQAVISAIESGDADLGKLEKHLKEHRNETRKFAAAFISTDEGSLSNSGVWKTMLEPLHQNLCKKLAESKPHASEAELEILAAELLAKDESRSILRDSMAKKMATDKRATTRIHPEFFGNKPNPLKATDESGEAARTMLLDALTLGYLEALVDRKLVQFGGEWDDLE